MKLFLHFLKEYNYWVVLLPFIPVCCFLYFAGSPNFFLFLVLIIFPCFIGIRVNQEYNEYCEFKRIIESGDYTFFIQDVKASGTIDGYYIGNKSDLIFKDDYIYWLTYTSSLVVNRGRGILFCIEFGEFRQDTLNTVLNGSFFKEVQTWKITSRGNIQLRGKGEYPRNAFTHTGVEINIFSNTEAIKQYLPKTYQIGD